MRLRPAIAILTLIALYPAYEFGLNTSASNDPEPAPSLAEALLLTEMPAPAPLTDAAALTADLLRDHAPAGDPAPPDTRLAANPEPEAGLEPDPEPQERVLVVSRGDTLAGLLDDAGIDSPDAHAAIERLTRHFRPTSLRPGDEIAIRVSPGDTPTLLEIEIEPEPGRTVRAMRQADGSWDDEETISERTRFVVRAEGSVDGGLFPAMTRSGVPAAMALSLIRILGHQVDFQRDLQPGDTFAVLFERFRGSEGDVLGHGQILTATLTASGRRLEVWRHKNRQGDTDWYDQEGRSLRRSFLRTPLDGARISSGFGRRTHPILGFNRMHQGIDFAAPSGTPVYAAADGTILSAKREGGYGLMVRIRHAGGIETRYAHLSRFSRGAIAGRRVSQGTVVGAVGSTGMSTGPHLHYEVFAGGRAVNPARHVQPMVALAGADLTAYRAHQRRLTRLASGFGARDELAMASD